MHLEWLLEQHRQLAAATAKRILEINPRHPLIARLAAMVDKHGAGSALGDFAWLWLLDQARILEGEQLPDPGAFARRLASVLEKGLAGSRKRRRALSAAGASGCACNRGSPLGCRRAGTVRRFSLTAGSAARRR